MAELETLGVMIEADMAAHGETADQYAERRGITRATLQAMADCSNAWPIARLLAQEMRERLERQQHRGFIPIKRLRLVDLPMHVSESELPY